MCIKEVKKLLSGFERDYSRSFDAPLPLIFGDMIWLFQISFTYNKIFGYCLNTLQTYYLVFQ
jgi:hypothetical protein